MFSEKIMESLSHSSWIRAMFEQGAKLAEKYGAENVYDYSLGNPYAEPPKEVQDALKKYVDGEYRGLHRYMNNAGYPEVRKQMADDINKTSKVKLGSENVIMTVGAAGGLNVTMKALLNPDEEVIIFAPYFVEYNFYASNHGGKAVVMPANTETFGPNLEAFEAGINSKTKAVIVNIPNNPTGVIYSDSDLKKMAEIIERKEKELGITIFVISDQPYSAILYDNAEMPNLMNYFENAIIINSFSKSLGLAGERIGYIAASPQIKDVDKFMLALSFCNRTLGFVNAPGLFQKVVGDAVDAKVDVEAYKKRRDYLYDNLTKMGFEIVKPEGAFYLFPKALEDDDVAFIKKAVEHNLLLVPGSGFGCPGYFRMSYCVEMDMIERSMKAFEELAKDYNL
ncbi:MAG: pyridoxal phosphate-dependent aminotransferase [Tissierellales bacterium]|jgi:aspartate aminotransferase|nr:pyridoxal phosphate-dependent aminotransferase [Tissierellales bacterium]